MLCRELQNYISSAKGLPFFYVVGDEDYNSVLKEMIQGGMSVVRASDFCPKNDKFPSVDDLIDFFRTSDIDYRDNKFVVVGLGEFLAMKGNAVAERELRRLKNTTLGNARVVLLLRGVSSQTVKLIAEDNRMVEQQRAFVSANNKFSVRITNIPNGEGIVAQKGIKTLLYSLEDGLSGDIMACTGLTLQDAIIPVKTLDSSYRVIKNIVCDFPYEESNGTESLWLSLLRDIKECNNNLYSVFEKYSIDDSVFDYFYESISGLEYRNWLVFLYLKSLTGNYYSAYLKYVLEETTNYADFKNNILTGIIDFTHSSANFMGLYSDRKKLVKGFPEEDIAIFIKENEIDPEESIYRLTDNTSIERKAIIKWISAYGITDAIKYVYPDLSEYLKKYIFDLPSCSDELTEYFDEYKKQKVTNKINPDFIKRVEDYASRLLYAKLPTRDNAIKSIADKDNAYLYWIDALGVEYLSYIVSLAKKKGLSIHIDITRSDLPTITAINKQFYEQWTGGKKYKEEQLDNIKHNEKGGYFFTDDEDPIHIVSELQVIERAISTAATELAMHKCKSFVIASDHGASRLAVIYKQEIPYDTDTKGEHSGRCCKTFDGCDVEFKTEENGYIVLSNYGRFKKSRAANVEVHGGATLEEIVVPVITLKLKKQFSIQIKVMNPDNIVADRHTGISLSLYISNVNSKDNVSIVIENNRYCGKSKDDSHFEFNIPDIKRGKTKPYTADVFDSEDLIGTISFRVKGKAATVNDDFNFGSDDNGV